MPDTSRRCPTCAREFKKNDHYQRHLRSHTNEKPFGCRLCRKFFSRRDTLIRHLRTHKLTQGHGRPSPPERNGRSQQPDVPSGVSECELDPVEDDMILPSTTTAGFEDPTVTDPFCQSSPYPRVSSATYSSSTPHVSSEEVIRRSSHKPTTQPGINPAVVSGRHVEAEGERLFIDALADDDPLLHFDPSNWLLDENLVSCGIGELGRTDRGDNDWLFFRSRPLSPADDRPPVAVDLRHMWYVDIRRTNESLYDDEEDHERERTARQASSTAGREINDRYRTGMLEQLHTARCDNDSIPSINLLNLCIHLFFTRFIPSFPVIHTPTFRPTEDNMFLVLTMCCIGATFTTSDVAVQIGSTLFDRVYKAGNSSPWEKGLSERPHLTRDNIKAAAIGQTFAMLSGDSTHHTIADSVHGSLISLCRHSGLFNQFPEIDLPGVLSPEAVERYWRQWARCEEMKRIAVILHIQDAEISALFHHEPILRYNPDRLPGIAPAELFQAPTAALWASQYITYRKNQRERDETSPRNPARLHPCLRLDAPRSAREPASSANPPESSMLNSWAELSSIGATIREMRCHNNLPPYTAQLEKDLSVWFTTKTCCTASGERQNLDPVTQSELPFCLRPLWHHTFMCLTTDLNLLELAVGREGSNVAASQLAGIKAWITSPECKRCLLHAVCLQNLVTANRVDSVIAIYTSRILFAAALCWYCFMLYSPWCAASSSSMGSNDALSPNETIAYLRTLPEVRLLLQRDEHDEPTTGQRFVERALSDLRHILRANPAEMKASTLCILEATLRQLRTSGISQQFADLVQAFIMEATQG